MWISSVSGGTAPYVYSLNGDNFQTDTLFTSLSGGTQTVTVQDANGCETSQVATIFEPQEIVVTVTASTELPDNTILMGDSTELMTEVNVLQTVTYSWTPVESLSCTDCANPVASPLETTTYTVVVTDDNNCSATAEITIIVNQVRDVYIPNAFTPNGDGINDVFYPFSNEFGISQINYFRVYDRWGELVFEATQFQPNDPLYGWDGTFKGKSLNPAAFVYYTEVQYVDGVVEMIKGDVTIVK